ATRAPLGQVLGVSFLPTLAVPTACRICSSVESTVIGLTAAAGCWRDAGAGWALGALQPGSNPRTTSGTAHVSRLREKSIPSPSLAARRWLLRRARMHLLENPRNHSAKRSHAAAEPAAL